MRRRFWKAKTTEDRHQMFMFLRFLQTLKITREEANNLWRYEVQGMIK